jgi:isoamylase
MRLSAGTSARLGASWDGRGTNFALFSTNAHKVELCLFDSQGRREVERIELPERTEDVWHGYLNDISPGQLYGYRVHGLYEPEHGHRFNANKLLLDPYARRLAGRLVWSDAHFAYRTGSAREDLSFDRRDNARGMPKAVVVDEAFNWGRRETRPSIPWEDTIIYEAHVKGLTQTREDVPSALRGTYRGLSSPTMIDHFKRLGITTVELLPIHGLVDDRRLIEQKLVNYWGYNSLSFFAPEPRYGQDNPLDAFRTTVARLHDAGIEVMLDVVYNHTAEGNHLGPTLSFRGIDNSSYYWLKPDNPRFYDDFTGCGSSVNLTHPRVLQMVMDSLRYWVEVCHVDGFRFDLATTLARGVNGFDRNSGFITAIRQDPVLASVKLIAEPWDLGMGGYQVGAFPSQWSEWNDRYRSTMRRYWSGEGNLIGEVSRRMTGSSDLFNHDRRATRASINQ